MKFKYDDKTKKIVVSDAESIEYNQLKLWLKRHIKGWRFNPLVKRGIWDGKIDFFNNGKINFGLWKECYRGLYEIGYKFEIENKHEFPINRDVTLESVNEFCEEFFKNHKIIKDDGTIIDFMPYDYQQETAYKILKNRYCLGEVATSGGKSLILSIVFFYILKHINPDAKILLLVPSISLVSQMYDSIFEFNKGFNDTYVNENMANVRLQEIMSDKPRKHSGQEDPNIFISTYQSLAKVENWGDEFYEQFDVIAVDEAHLSKSKSFTAILEKTLPNSEYQFGVSGTFPKEDTCEILTIQSLTGPKVTSIKAKKLVEEGRITPVEVKQIILNHDDYDFDDRLRTIRKNRNKGGDAYRLEGEYVRSSDKRDAFITKIVNKCKGNTLLLFNIIEYGQKLYDKILESIEDKENTEVYFISGEVKKKDRQEIFDKMELDDGVKRILIATYGTLSTGVSINNLYNVIFAESFKSESRIIQSIGRGLRKFADKNKAIIFDIVDCFREDNQTNAFYRHGKERRTMYNEHAYPYKISKFIL